jgi:tetratricopeptide (TPR) repeat protein
VILFSATHDEYKFFASERFIARRFSAASSLLFALLAIAAPLFPQTKPTPESFDSIAQRAAAARDADRLDEAVLLYKKALAVRPQWAEGWWSLGTLEYDRNNYRSAAAAFRQLVPLAPNNGTAYAMLGLSEFELGQDAAALRDIEKAKRLELSSNPQLRLVVLYHDGILLLRAGRYQAAQTPLGALCRETVPNDTVVQALGLAVFRLSLKDAPPVGTPGAEIVQRVGHAACISVQKKYDQARKEYTDLLAEYPDYPQIHYVFGKFLGETNDVGAAVAEYQKEIQHNPKDINSRLEIAATQYKINSAAGIPYAEEAVALNPHVAFAHYLLGLLYLDVDEYKKAIPQLEMAQKAFSRDAKVYFALGSAYSRAGRKREAEKARALFQKLSQESDDDSNASY